MSEGNNIHNKFLIKNIIDNAVVADPEAPLFGMESCSTRRGPRIPDRWNGNIMRADWKGKDNVPKRYNYGYDPVGRIAAAYTMPSATAQNGRYNLSGITYDPNGNITAMQRSNQRTATTYGRVDNLAYTYDTHGNRLLQVADSYTSTGYTAKDFKERSGTGYTYDATTTSCPTGTSRSVPLPITTWIFPSRSPFGCSVPTK